MTTPTQNHRLRFGRLLRSAALLLAVTSFVGSSLASAGMRKWSTANGAYTVEGEAIAFSETTVVLKKADGGLIALELKDLSDADREYVNSKEAKDEAASADKMQTWTSVDGMKVTGRVVAYGQRQVSVQRRRGRVHVGETEFSKIQPMQQKVILKVVSKLEDRSIEDERQLTEWTVSLGGQPRTYDLDGVLIELETGEQIAVPFFMFSQEDLKILEPGWQLWLEQHESERMREHESFLVRAQAQAYQADRAAQRQIEMVKLELLAAATGVTSIWEVGLVPSRGGFARPMVVMVSARDSATATFQAMQRYPGFIVGGVRRLSR